MDKFNKMVVGVIKVVITLLILIVSWKSYFWGYWVQTLLALVLIYGVVELIYNFVKNKSEVDKIIILIFRYLALFVVLYTVATIILNLFGTSMHGVLGI